MTLLILMFRSSRYNVKSIKKLRYIGGDINDIFKTNAYRNKDRKDALLYQDILEYFFVVNKTLSENSPFRLRDLQKWTVRKNVEIADYYKGSKSRTSSSNKIHAKEGRINSKFENLIHMGLIHESGTGIGRKVKVDVPLYSYTKSGRLLVLIIKSMNLKNEFLLEKDQHKMQNKKDELKRNNQVIFELIDSTLPIGDNYPYANIFYKSFYKKTKEEGVFDKLVMHMVDLCNSNKKMENVDDLLESIYDLAFKDKADRRKFFDLWYENLEEQKPEVKDIFLYQMKLSAERRFFEAKNRQLSRKYEREQFKFRADHEKIVLEGNCEKCKQPTIVVCSYTEYRERFADMDGNDIVKFDCQSCKTKGSCIIPNF
jgi:hypothetical protein